MNTPMTAERLAEIRQFLADGQDPRVCCDYREWVTVEAERIDDMANELLAEVDRLRAGNFA